jgi:hypothetical protein
MDPYLEAPAGWKGVHGLLLARIVADLNRDLPPGFIAKLDERGYVTPPQRDIYPDVSVRQTPAAAATAVLPALRPTAPPTGIAVLAEEERRDRFVQVVDLRRGGNVVTVIELLSPANKTPGNPGRDSYLRKQGEVLDSETSLLEIDLLRAGAHTVAVPEAHLPAGVPRDYRVCLHRPWLRDEFPYWLIGVRDPLPAVPVPLTEDLGDVPLDLQAALNRTYDDGAFAREIDYRLPAEPPLAPPDDAWAATLLRGAGLRP